MSVKVQLKNNTSDNLYPKTHMSCVNMTHDNSITVNGDTLAGHFSGTDITANANGPSLIYSSAMSNLYQGIRTNCITYASGFTSTNNVVNINLVGGTNASITSNANRVIIISAIGGTSSTTGVPRAKFIASNATSIANSNNYGIAGFNNAHFTCTSGFITPKCIGSIANCLQAFNSYNFTVTSGVVSNNYPTTDQLTSLVSSGYFTYYNSKIMNGAQLRSTIINLDNPVFDTSTLISLASNRSSVQTLDSCNVNAKTMREYISAVVQVIGGGTGGAGAIATCSDVIFPGTDYRTSCHNTVLMWSRGCACGEGAWKPNRVLDAMYSAAVITGETISNNINDYWIAISGYTETSSYMD